jgi:prepilin-type N-terminal cleavage/methylation domain-containing protein
MKERVSQKRNEAGFTLFELLIVIIILAILAAIVAFSVGSSTANAATSTCQSDARAFGTALEEYKSSVGVFPGAVALQVTGATNPIPQPLPNLGQTWSIANPLLQLPGTYGILGNPSASDGTWTAPNGVTLGPFMRQLPSTQHYRIVTDGQGGVFVYPPATTGVGIPRGATQTNQTVSQAYLGQNSDSNSMNFETDPGICSDPLVVS